MSKKYHLYGIGAALVDTEIEVSDAFLAQAQIEKGVMTLVDEARQHQLIDHLQDHLVGSKRASGGSADTMTWFLFQSSAASVSVLHRGFIVVLAEGLRRDEAEELAHRVARVLERLPG